MEPQAGEVEDFAAGVEPVQDCAPERGIARSGGPVGISVAEGEGPQVTEPAGVRVEIKFALKAHDVAFRREQFLELRGEEPGVAEERLCLDVKDLAEEFAGLPQ